MTRKVLFIINPNAGKKNPDHIVNIIRTKFPGNILHEIIIWENKNNFTEINNKLLHGGFTDAVAVGGDGTVNQVAKSLLNSSIRLGIIPIGSGNGLARTLGLSMKTEEALVEVAQGVNLMIDYGTVNGTPFFCTSGIGFDAHIGNLFAESATRGLKTYVKIVLMELLRYRAKEYTIHLNGQTFKRKAFLITVANSGQYGNDFFIAPQAKIRDGLFHVVILKPFNVFSLTGIFSKIIRKKAHLNRNIETYVTKSVRIERSGNDTIHFDGEPRMEKNMVEYMNNARSISVITGKNFAEALN